METICFDRQLRLIVMDAIERVEIAIRTQLAYHHAHHHGCCFAYAEKPDGLPDIRSDQRNKFLAALADEMRNSKETFAEHFRNKYGKDHAYMPIWMAAEIMTFGNMLTLFRGSSSTIKRSVAAMLDVHDNVMKSRLLSLNTIRNICAHHGRLWNRALGVKPLIPDKDTQWHAPVAITNGRIFCILTILKYCLDRIAPQSAWPQRVHELLNKYPDIPHSGLGFPDNWLKCPLWSEDR